MTKKDDQNEALVELFARMKAGVTINPEDADRFAAAVGVDADEVASRALVLDPVFEWEDAQTRQSKIRTIVTENQVAAENEANKVLAEGTTVVPSPSSHTGSNDPEVNVAASGKEPFSDTTGVGHSGQVIDPESYKDDK